MEESLFRQEAIESQTTKVWGELILWQPFSLTAGGLLGLFIVTLTFAFLFFGEYQRKIPVSGSLVPDKGLIQVYAPGGGHITHLALNEGSDVTADQPLFKVVNRRHDSQGHSFNARLLDEINQQVSLAEGHLAKISARYSQRRKMLERETEGLAESTRLLKQSDRVAKQRHEVLLKEHQVNLQLLAVQATTIDKVRSSEGELLAGEEQLLDVRRRLNDKQQAYQNTSSKLEELNLLEEEELSAARDKVASLLQKSLELSGTDEYAVHAPISGRVAAMNAWVGMPVTQETTVLTILPSSSQLEAHLLIPTKAIGFIKEGQSVKLHYDAFPFQKFGSYTGTVGSISRSIILGDKPSQGLTPNHEPVYRVVVNLERQGISAFGKDLPLQAGMTLKGIVLVDRRKIFEWLLEPFYAMKGST